MGGTNYAALYRQIGKNRVMMKAHLFFLLLPDDFLLKRNSYFLTKGG